MTGRVLGGPSVHLPAEHPSAERAHITVDGPLRLSYPGDALR